MYWLFGFKYWLISIEIPYLLEKKRDEDIKNEENQNYRRLCSEMRYKILNWVGIMVNFISCAFSGYKRG